MVFDKIKRALSGSRGDNEDIPQEYLEIDLDKEEEESKVLVKLFALKQYDDVNDILDALREGYTITIIDIKELRKRDSIELKRAIAKIKKTTDALEGNIAGFGENMVIVTPSFAKILKENSRQNQGPKNKFE
ncbi:cell division protein SepF [Candidatus Pacearchaeota archaeon]|nr:cell division protein SepF [Candidatus Pacearchaeota archaeon]